MSGIFSNDPTDDDCRIPGWGRFEGTALRELHILYPRDMHRFRLRETFEIDGHTICPDIAVFVDGTTDCACVAEAKHRQVLELRDVEMVILYKRLLKAEKAVVFVPPSCDVRDGALERARANRIELEPLAAALEDAFG